MKKYVIFAPPYDERSGGSIGLHALCSLINATGRSASLHPWFHSEPLTYRNVDLAAGLLAERNTLVTQRKLMFPRNPRYTTPITHLENGCTYGADWIAIYPEVTFGNPLGATNVVRWLLHDPGYHSGKIYYDRGEYHIRYNHMVKPFHFPDCHLSERMLEVVEPHLDLFNTQDAPPVRTGSAYCMRKGQGKPLEHQLEGSTLVDGMSLEQIAATLKRVEVFYSYDPMTYLSTAAVLCGCDSVVVPTAGLTEEEWRPKPADRHGLAYGVENIPKARATAHLVRDAVQAKTAAVADHVAAFLAEVESFFSC